MPPSRSRKRDLTLQTLDILNNVGANPRSRVLHPPRRKLYGAVQAQIPQSDGVWNVPGSPEKRGENVRGRVGGSEPITPRRSKRIRDTGISGGDDKAVSGSGKSLRSLRSTRGVDYLEESEEEREERGEGESDEESEEQEQEQEDDEEQEIRLFSDDEPETTDQPNKHTLPEQSDNQEFPSFLSPTALLNGQAPSSDNEPDEFDGSDETYANNAGQSEEAEDANRPSEANKWRHPPTPVVEIRLPQSSPHKPRNSPPEQVMRSGHTERESEWGSDDSESEEEQLPDNAVDEGERSCMSILHRPRSPAGQEWRLDQSESESNDYRLEEEQPPDNAIDEDRSSRTSISHRPRSSPAEQDMHRGHTERETVMESDDSESEEQLGDYAVDGGSISSFEPENEQDSSSSSPAFSDANAEDFPQSQTRKRRRVKRYSPGITRPRWNPSSISVTEESGESEDDENQETYNEEDEAEMTAVEEEQARKLQWMAEAMKLGEQRVNWLTLTRTAGELKQLSDPSLAESFVDIWTTIRVLSRLYGERDCRPSDMTLRQCDNLFGSIRCEGERLLDEAYHLATRPDGTRDDEVYACGLVDEFEARVIPEMVKLIFACFKSYYTDATMFPGMHDHFRRALVLLRQFCDRTTSMKMRRIVHGTVRCKDLGRALSAIIKALDSRALQRRESTRSYTSTPERSGPDEDDAGREWTQDEGLALIDGLRAYHGPDRYFRIIGHFGARLRHRTPEEVRAKAFQVHDRMRPKIAIQVQSAEGRRQWEWLLSVREA